MQGSEPNFPLSELGRGRFATVVWGDSRAVINRVLFAMVRANDPSPYWLEIQGPEDESTEPGPVELGWIARDRLLLTADSEEARPQNSAENLAMLVLSSSEDLWSAVISDMLRLPPMLQEVVGRVHMGGGPHAIAIANADRISQYYPTQQKDFRAIGEALLAAPLLPFMSTVHPTERRFAADFVFEIRVRGLDDWEDGLLVCEKAPPTSSIPTDTQIPLASYPAVARALEGSPPA